MTNIYFFYVQESKNTFNTGWVGQKLKEMWFHHWDHVKAAYFNGAITTLPKKTWRRFTESTETVMRREERRTHLDLSQDLWACFWKQSVVSRQRYPACGKLHPLLTVYCSFKQSTMPCGVPLPTYLPAGVTILGEGYFPQLTGGTT